MGWLFSFYKSLDKLLSQNKKCSIGSLFKISFRGIIFGLPHHNLMFLVDFFSFCMYFVDFLVLFKTLELDKTTCMTSII